MVVSDWVPVAGQCIVIGLVQSVVVESLSVHHSVWHSATAPTINCRFSAAAGPARKESAESPSVLLSITDVDIVTQSAETRCRPHGPSADKDETNSAAHRIYTADYSPAHLCRCCVANICVVHQATDSRWRPTAQVVSPSHNIAPYRTSWCLMKIRSARGRRTRARY